MIGFKATEDYSFDECLMYLTEHGDKDSIWVEINNRYHKLLAHFQKDDELTFSRCSTTQDYKDYLSKFKNLSGASKYQPLHETEAKVFLRDHSAPIPQKGFFSSYKVDVDKRNPRTNYVLYLLLFASLVATILQIPGVISTFGYFYEDGWPFIEAYGKGLMPGFLLSTFALIGVSKIIKWKRSGLSIMIISFIIILLPTICNEYLEFICFSTPAILGVSLLWGLLKLKKNGISTWNICKATPRWLGILQRLILIFWVFIITLLPPIVALSIGFRGNLYSNGMRCLDAHFNDSPYYSYDLYQRILLGDDYTDDIYEKQSTAESWLSNAKFLNNHQVSDYDFEDEFSRPVIFLNNLIFKMQNKGHQDAMEYINSEKDHFDMSIIFKYLDGTKNVMGDYEYFQPNKDNVMSLLNEAGVYETVEVEVPDEWAVPAEAYEEPYDEIPNNI